MSRSIKLVFVTFCVLASAFAVAAPASAASSISATGTLTPGSTVQVSSSFVAPSSGANNYMLDTEVYAPSGARVAQWTEQAWLSSSPNVRKYSWNTTGLAAGKYRVAQGIFTTNWSVTRSWVSEAGFITLANAQPWSVSATASNTGSISAKFNVPSGFATTKVTLDTEIYGPSGTKVAQWAEQPTVSASQSISRNYTWSTAGKPVGTYTVKQGVFAGNWGTALIWNGNTATFTIAPPVTTTTTVAPAPIANFVSNATAAVSNFWVDPSNPAARQAKEWQSSRPADAAYMARIAQGGAAVWLGGWNTNVSSDVAAVVNSAANTNTTPVFVAYNIPGRDCGSYSAGGASGSDAYRSWINAVANGIGDKKAWVVLEPDALSQLDCLSPSMQNDRLSLLKGAVQTLEAKPNVSVYIDAGHPGWHSASTMAQRLKSAGVASARGFSLNVSNFTATKENVAYGESVSSLIGGKGYIVDTSRNGKGSNGEWCNPSGRALGEAPTAQTGAVHADAYLWIKRPGESDGTCNGGPSAGQWWADYALGLAKSAWG